MIGAPALDHLIMVVPDSSPSALKHISDDLGFTILPGGTHADGLTCNSLVVLQDGSYLEFISFVDPDSEASKRHWWSGKPANAWSDWCLSPLPTTLSARLDPDSPVSEWYQEPQRGGRVKPDAQQTRLEWRVAFPKLDAESGRRGKLPFWCEDVTDRSLRVPAGGEAATHANGVTGVREIVVLVKDDESRDELGRKLAKVLGNDELRVAKVDSSRSSQAQVVLRIARTDEETAHIEKAGESIYSVTFASPIKEVTM